YRTTAEVIKTEFTTQDEEEHFDASVTPQQTFLESPLVETTLADEQDDYYDSREASAADRSIVERSATAEEYSHQSSVEKEETDELQVAHEYEILQKSSATEIQLESPHGSDHEDEDQYNPESTVSPDAIKTEHSETVEHDRHEPMLVSQHQQHVASPVIERRNVPEDEEQEGETHIVVEEIQQKLTATEIQLESPRESDHEEEDQYNAESTLSSDAIKIEHTETVEQDPYEPMLVSQQQEHVGSHVIESPYTPEDEEEPGETHVADEEIQQKLTATEIHLESPHESDHEKDEQEEPYQSEQKLSSDQITLESPHITEQDEDELSSKFEAVVIPSHEVIEQVAIESALPREPESDKVEYAENYESDQEVQEYRTTAVVTKTEFTTQDDEEHFEASATPQQKFLESPLVETTSADAQDDYYDSRDASAADTSIVEHSATAEGYSYQSSVEKEATDGLQVAHEFEILKKSSGSELQLESEHESDREEYEEQDQVKRTHCPDEAFVGTPEVVEHEKSLFEQLYSDGQVYIEPRDAIDVEESEEDNYQKRHERFNSQMTEVESLQSSELEDQEDVHQRLTHDFPHLITPCIETGETNLNEQDEAQMERGKNSAKTSPSLTQVTECTEKVQDKKQPSNLELVVDENPETIITSEKYFIQSSGISEQQEEQYHPESKLGSDAIKTEHTATVEHDRHEPMLVSQSQQHIGSPVTESQYRGEDEEESGETYIGDEEIHQKLTATEIHLESSHESDHEEEDQYNPESTVSSDVINIEHTETVEQDPYEPMLVSQHQQHVGSPVVESPYTREDEERAGETHIVDEEIQQKLTATEIQLESPHESDHEKDEEEEPYQSEQKLNSDPITIESSHIMEQDQHELSSSFEADVIPSHQITEQRLNTEQVVVESSATSAPEQDEDQYDSEGKIYAVAHLIESLVTNQEEKEQVEEEPLVLESHAEEKYEIERSSDGQHIHIESPHESEHEEEKQQQLSSELERVTEIEQDQYVPTLSLEQVLIDYREATLSDNETEKAIHEVEEVLSTESFTPLSLQQSEQHQGVDYYQEKFETVQHEPESMTSSPQIKLEYAEEYDNQEQLELQQETDEIPMSEEYEINRKSSDAEIQLESPHESDHVEKVEQHSPVHEHTTTQFVAESTEEVDQDEYKPTLSIEHILHQYKQVMESETRGLKEIDDMKRMLESVHPLTISSQFIDEKQNSEEEEEEEESKTSTDMIKVEADEDIEQERDEPVFALQQQFIQSSELDASCTDERKDHYDSKEKLANDEIIIESSASAKEETTDYHQEPLESEKAAAEIEPKSTDENIYSESPDASDREELEELDELDQKLNMDEVEQLMEDEKYKQISSFEQVPASFQQEIEIDEQESERKSSSEKVTVESSYGIEHEEQPKEQVEDQYREQYAPESELLSSMVPIETVEPVEKQSHTPLSTDINIIESSHILDEERRSDDQESLKSEEATGDVYKKDAVDIERKSVDDEDIRVESPRESNHEDENEQYPSEPKRSSDEANIEPAEAHLYESSRTDVYVPESTTELDNEFEIERRLSSDKGSIGSGDHLAESQKSQIEFEPEESLRSEIQDNELTRSSKQHEEDILETTRSSPSYSEKSEEEHVHGQQENAIISETTDLSPKNEEKSISYESQLSTEKITAELLSAGDIVEHKPEIEFVEKPNTVKFIVASTPSSEEEEEEEEREGFDYEQKVQTEPFQVEDQEGDRNFIKTIEMLHTFRQEEDENQFTIDLSHETQPEQNFDADEILIESSDETEHQQVINQLVLESDQAIQSDESEPSEAAQQVPIASHRKIPTVEVEHDRDEYFTSGPISKEFDQKIKEELPELEDEYGLERKSSTDKISLESPREIEHTEEVLQTTHLSDDEEKQKSPITDITTEISEQVIPEQHKLSSLFEQEQSASHEPLERKSSTEQPILESPKLSEHYYNYEVESSHLTQQEEEKDLLENSQTIEPDNIRYEQPLSSGNVDITFPQQFRDDSYKLQSQHEFALNSTLEQPIEKTSQELEYPYEDFQRFEQEINDDNFINLQSASFQQEAEDDDDDIERTPLKRPQEWKQSSFQRDEIYGNKYRPNQYSIKTCDDESQLPSDFKEVESPIISHIQHADIISRTITSYPDDEELEEERDDDFRPTHLDISMPDKDDNEKNVEPTSTIEDQSYEKVLIGTSNDIVNQILKEAVRETSEQDFNYSLYQTAKNIVHDVIDSIQKKYDDEIVSSNIEEATSADVSISDLTDWSALVKTSIDTPKQENFSDNDEEKQVKNEHDLSDNEEYQEKFHPETRDLPYLMVSDVVTSKSTQELGDLVQELQTLEQQINENIDIHHSSSSSSSSVSENDEIHHYDLNIAQISTTKASASVNELTDLVSELKNVEEQLEDKLDSELEEPNIVPVSSTSMNELGNLIHELNDVTEDLNERFKHEEVLQLEDIDTLSNDIVQYRHDSQTNPTDSYTRHSERRPSSPPGSPLIKEDFLHVTCSSMNDVDQVQEQLRSEHEENKILQDMINLVIQQAHHSVQSEPIDIPHPTQRIGSTLMVDQRRAPYVQSSATSISDELDFSHDDSTTDKTSELAAQLDYLRRMSRYENLPDDHHHAEIKPHENSRTIHEDATIQITSCDDQNDIVSPNYLSIVHEEQPFSDEHEEDRNEDKDEDKEKQKKSKGKCSTDDDKPLFKHDDSDDDDDNHDHKDNKPVIPLNISETTQHESSQQSTSTESNKQQTEEYQHQQQQMEMSRDSISELMIMSQDSLKQRSTDSLESEQELKYLQSEDNTPLTPSNETDDYIINQHTNEPTPSHMLMKYEEDDTSDFDLTTKQYPLISNEIETGQLPVIHARRTASENSLLSTSSSSAHMYDSHSLSASCLADKDDLTPSNDYIDYHQNILYDDSQKHQQIYRDTTTTTDDNDFEFSNSNPSSSTAGIGFLGRVKALVSKPVEIVQEAMENRRRQRSTSSLNSNTDLNDKPIVDDEQKLFSSSPSTLPAQQHFHSAYDLNDEEKLKLVRSPELYNMDNVNDNNRKILVTNLQLQNRTQSESALIIDDSKRHSIGTASNEASEEFLPTISKDNSLEFIQQHQPRHSTPFDDVVEKESSSEHSESYNIPACAFSDTFEPTSSCQRPLALMVPGQQPPPPPLLTHDEQMTEEEFDTLATDFVCQILSDALTQMTGDHDDSCESDKDAKLTDNHTSSDDDDADEVIEEDEEENKRNPIPTDTSSFSVNDRYSADESSNTREHSGDEENSARSSTTATPTKTSAITSIHSESFDFEPTSTPVMKTSPSSIRHGSQSDTGTFFSIVSPSSGDYLDVRSSNSANEDDKLHRHYQTQSNSSQYLTATDETPNVISSDDNDYVNERGTVNYGYNDSSSDEKYSSKSRPENFTITKEKIPEERYSGEGEESSGGNQNAVQQKRKRSSEQRSLLLNDLTLNISEPTATTNTAGKSVSFKLDLNENFVRSPRLSTSSATAMPRQESLDSPLNDSNDKSIIKILQEEILRSNLETIKSDLEINNDQYDSQIHPTASTPTTIQPTKVILSSSEYDAGSESDRDSTLVDSIKSTIQEELNEIYQTKESFIDRIKLKFARSLDRLVEKALAGDENMNKSDIISPFTDQSLDRSLPLNTQQATMTHAHSEQLLQACPDELDYGTLQRFSSDSCIIIHVPEQYTPSSTLFFDQLKNDQTERKSSSNQQASAFSYYTKQDHPQPSSSPIEMINSTNELIDNISPINRYTPRSLDDSSIEFGERDMTEMSDEFVLVKNLSPSANTKDIKNETPSNTSSSSSDKHESPDLIDILQHQCDYPPLDTGFDLRSGTTLETVYESPELRHDEIKSAISTLSLTASETNRPYSADHNSSQTPNTDDSLMEFERIEMELLKNGSTTNIVEIVREIRSSVDLLSQQHDDNDKVESFIDKHFSSINNDVKNVLDDIIDAASDLTHSISSQSDATTVIYRSQRQSFDDDYVEITHEDIKNQQRNIFLSEEDIRLNQTESSSQDKRRLSAPNNDHVSRRLKTPSSSSSSSSSFSSTSRSVIYSQQHSHPSYQQPRLLQAETDLASFKQQQQTQSATDLPFLPPFVNTNPAKRPKQSSSVSSTPALFHADLPSGHSKKKTQSHPGSLGGTLLPPRSSLIKEEILSSPIPSVSPHSSSSSHHSDDCFCAEPATTTSHQH
ncbi:unnamed protein product, partial [Rotaria socialis]